MAGLAVGRLLVMTGITLIHLTQIIIRRFFAFFNSCVALRAFRSRVGHMEFMAEFDQLTAVLFFVDIVVFVSEHILNQLGF